MNIYYLQPHRPAGKADIYCVVLEGNNKGYITQYHLKENFAATFRHSEKYLKRNYINNYNEYKLMNADAAKEQIVKADLEMHLPKVQRKLFFENTLNL